MSIYFVFSLFLLQAGTEATKFKVKLMTITRCKVHEAKMSPEYHPFAQFTINKLDRETTVLSGNFTFEKRLGPISISYRTYQLQQNAARNLIFKLERITCTNPFTYKLIQLLHVNITKDCYVLPGFYSYKKLNLDHLSWLMSKSITAQGRYLYEVEFHDSQGVLSCYDLVCDLSEQKRKT